MGVRGLDIIRGQISQREIIQGSLCLWTKGPLPILECLLQEWMLAQMSMTVGERPRSRYVLFPNPTNQVLP